MPSRSLDPILIAGTGRVAQAMGRLLAEHGEPVFAVAGRDPGRTAVAAAFIGHGARPADLGTAPKRCSRVLIAVSDSAIPEVARQLAESGMKRGMALHTCGAMGREALAPLAAAGLACGAIHPLQSVASPEQGLSALANCAYAIEGEPAALEWAGRIAATLGGPTLLVPPESRPLYHAAAVMAGNYVIALMDAAAILMKAAGIGQEAALRALAPVVEASTANALRLGPVEALTGPVQRGDAQTIQTHMHAVKAAPASVRALYVAAGLHALGIAVRRGLAPELARMVEKALREGNIEDGRNEQAGAGS
jgi:predicted short-subunit dehydrogenase-like oxidoreductase (DUF2520 family)